MGIDEDLKRAKELNKTATPGPWRFENPLKDSRALDIAISAWHSGSRSPQVRAVLLDPDRGVYLRSLAQKIREEI